MFTKSTLCLGESARDAAEATSDTQEPARRAYLGPVCAMAALALLATGTGVAWGSALVPQIQHPGVFFEKYAPGSELPYFDDFPYNGGHGAPRVFEDEDISTPNVQDFTVSYEEKRQRVLANTFYEGGGPFDLPTALVSLLYRRLGMDL